jgi:YHS domain-containing protein
VIRRLVTLVLVAAAFFLFGRLLRLFRSSAGRSVGDAGRAIGSTKLVRDSVCNTFVPRDTALVLKASGETLYFCSPECRSRHLDRTSGRGDASVRAS